MEQENKITCYLKICGSMGSEYEIDRIAGTVEQIEAALKEVLEKEIENVAEYLESKGIPVLLVASSIDDEPTGHIQPDYEYDMDRKQIFRGNEAIGREKTREEAAAKLATELYNYADEVDPYGSQDSVEYVEEFIRDTTKDLLDAGEKTEGIMKWLEETPVVTEELELRGKELIEKVSAFTGIEIKQEATISFYVAECMEFPNLGEHHENLTLSEAMKLYEKIPAERMNGVKGIGFELYDGSMYDGQYPLMEAGKVD